MTPKEFLEQTSPNDKYGLRAELQKHRLRGMVEKEMEMYHEAKLKLLGVADDVKSLPNDDEVKAHIDTLPYYGTCTTEYNEGFEDGVKWLKEQLAK